MYLLGQVYANILNSTKHFRGIATEASVGLRIASQVDSGGFRQAPPPRGHNCKT